jgi:hypothetical protein
MVTNIQERLSQDTAVAYVNELVVKPMSSATAERLLGDKHNIRILQEIVLREVVYNEYSKLQKENFIRFKDDRDMLRRLCENRVQHAGVPDVFFRLSNSEQEALRYAWTVYRDELLEEHLKLRDGAGNN